MINTNFHYFFKMNICEIFLDFGWVLHPNHYGKRNPQVLTNIETNYTKLFVPQVEYLLPWSLPANIVGSIWANILQLGPTFPTEICIALYDCSKANLVQKKKETDNQNYKTFLYAYNSLELGINYSI